MRITALTATGLVLAATLTGCTAVGNYLASPARSDADWYDRYKERQVQRAIIEGANCKKGRSRK